MRASPLSDAEQRAAFRSLDAETARRTFESQRDVNNAQPWMAADLAEIERAAARKRTPR